MWLKPPTSENDGDLMFDYLGIHQIISIGIFLMIYDKSRYG